LRYGVVFSNEDGGTPTDRLMATWGRTTDIEYVYWVDVDESGNARSAGFEGAGHQIQSFAGKREDRHPLLWVATLNNMISDAGTTATRFRPAPFGFDLKNASREAVMDAHPWTYDVMAREIGREGKVKPTARPGSGEIPDPRRFVYVESCGELTNAAVAFAIGASDGRGAMQWFTSDADLPEFRIVRSGCFRAAIALPAEIDEKSLTDLRVIAFPRPTQAGTSPSRDAPRARITRVNKLFMLSEEYVPRPSRLTWDGDVLLTADRPSWTVLLPTRHPRLFLRASMLHTPGPRDARFVDYPFRARRLAGLTSLPFFQKSRGKFASSGGDVRRISASVIARRITFRFEDSHAYDVACEDYH
jgi:hypothetical protein